MKLSAGNDNDAGSVTFRFDGELSFFLSPEQKANTFTYRFDGRPSVKDAIEAHHVPHTEVGCILINGSPSDFTAHLYDTQHIEVYPVISETAVSCPLQLRSTPALRFVADVHLGKLTRYLRLLGFDVFYKRDFDDPDIIRCALKETRIILTRDRRMLHVKEIDHGCCLHSQNAAEQLHQLNERYSLKDNTKPFSRCLTCNGLLHDVEKDTIIDRLEPKTIRYYKNFKQCESCGKVFWRGSHIEALEKVLGGIADT